MRFRPAILALLLLAGSMKMTAQQTPAPPAPPAPPVEVKEEPKREIRSPLPRNPFSEFERVARKEAEEKTYRELKDAAAELAKISKEMSDEIEKNGQYAISAKIFASLDRIEDLTGRIRDRAK